VIGYLDVTDVVLEALRWYAYSLVALAGVAVLLEWTRR